MSDKEKRLNTALIIGRWQPWHKGHRELFKAALSRAEKVAIGVRATFETDGKNPFSFEEVKKFIDDDLRTEYSGKYDIIDLPNITNVIYGRDVGYKVEKISFDKETESISATKVRKSMNITPVSHDVSANERIKRSGHKGAVVWLTGLSGSGKTTLAKNVERKLFDKGYNVYMLDGDNVRDGLNSNLGFSDEDREENIRRIGEVAALFARAGFVVITAFISPFAKDRKIALNAFNDNSHEIYLSCDIETCEERDPKGLYKKARNGEISDFTGIDSPYEAPESPDLLINTQDESLKDCEKQLFDFVLSKTKT
jgi:adenylyl-sulfate kinase|tara:strand:+ start:3212 stop:4144 length:933 start_codon:yes stop_codon:yes gene_type:complete